MTPTSKNAAQNAAQKASPKRAGRRSRPAAGQRRRLRGTDPHPDDVAIVGVAGVFPGAPDAATFWANVRGGVDAITDAPEARWDPIFLDPDGKGADRFYTRRGGFVDSVATFDPLAFGIMPVAAETAEPDQLLALGATQAALVDAGQPHERVDPAKVAVLLGRGGYLGDGVARLDQRVRTVQQVVEVLRAVVPGITETQVAQVRAEFSDALGPERPEGSIGLVPNLAASRIANRFDFRGPAYTVDAACASSLVAVQQACDLLRSHRSDLVLAGGVHHCHDLTLWSVFTQLRALSPSGGIRPFSADADGILIGEGTGVLALRRWSDAVADGDRVYAVIRGVGVASDGRAASPMSPVVSGQVAAVRAAWRSAGLDPADVGLIEAHGTATPLGDRTEIATLREVFGDAGARIGLGSVKSMIGHAMPAAGAAGLVKAALALHQKVLPPTLHAAEAHPDLAGSRFELVAALHDWDVRPGSGPRLAGVNAFGFGGINAHAVLSESPAGAGEAAFPGVSSSAPDPVREDVPEPEEAVLVLAGTDASDLLAQLDALTTAGEDAGDAGDTGDAGVSSALPTGGPARLAVVAPDPRRLTLARKALVRAADAQSAGASPTAFRGRNDVWFDPVGLLRPDRSGQRGKVAFLFPGVEPEFAPAVDDVAARFGLAWEGFGSVEDGLQAHGRGILAVGRLLSGALERLGITPDLVAGHSLGEWTGQVVTEMVPAASVEELLDSLQPDSVEVPDVVFVALGAGAQVAEELRVGLDGVHVSHDNCTRQSVLCCAPGQVGAVLARARERRVLAQELPFRSGFHSPLFAPFVAGIEEKFGRVPVGPSRVPMWSATTAAPYPADREGILALSARHLVEPVRFRELTQALVADGAKAFVQVGSGSLVGFLDDTLRDVDALSVAALPPPGAPGAAPVSGLAQLRRVGLALWSAGLDVDLTLLGHPSAPPVERAADPAAGPAPVDRGRATPLRLGSPLVRDLTPLDLSPTSAPVPLAADASGDVTADASGRHGNRGPWPTIPMTSARVRGGDAVLSEFSALVQEATAAAQQVVEAAAHAVAPVAPVAPAAPSSSRPLVPTTREQETVLPLSVAAQPYWRDHAFYPQPDGWPVLEDRFPLVPMTALIEMMGDAAQRLVPGSVVASISQVRAFRWLAVEPAVEARVKAVVDDDASRAAAARLGRPTVVVRTTIDGHCRGVVTLTGSHLPAPAPRARPVTGKITPPWTPDTIYPDGHLFHGPSYRGIVSVEEFGEDGASAHLLTKPFPGSLLDNAGQVFGLWVAARVAQDRLVLPTSVEEFAFFGEHPAPGTRVRCVVNTTEIAEQHVRADLELSVEGRVWCRITGWEDRRFQSDERLFTLLREPGEHLLARPQPGGWFLVTEGWPDSASREVVMRRFLGQDERAEHATRTPRAQRTRLLGRIAAKDAVRARAFAAGATEAFPAQVTVTNTDSGRPVVSTTLPGNDDVQVSIAHTLGARGSGTGIGVALAASGTASPGIDVERVTGRSETFESTALTPAERTLLATRLPALTDPSRRDRELTRWWTAKEAAAKALGTGLQGRPRDFVVHEVRDSATPEDPTRVELRVGERWIASRSLHVPASPPRTPTTNNPPTSSPPASAPPSTAASSDVAPNEEYVVAWTL